MAAAKRRDAAAVHHDGSALRWPGAVSRFALFAEVLFTGVLVTVLALPLVTLPAALATGAGHLRRHLRAEDTSLRVVWSDFRAALPRGLLVGAGALAAAAVLAFDVVLASSSRIPGSPLVLAVGLAGLVALAVVLVAAAVEWSPEHGWRMRHTVRRLRSDPVAVVYLVAAVLLVAVIGWQLAPLAVPALGCLVFAGVTLRERRKGR